jgi:hypothetical protein
MGPDTGIDNEHGEQEHSRSITISPDTLRELADDLEIRDTTILLDDGTHILIRSAREPR